MKKKYFDVNQFYEKPTIFVYLKFFNSIFEKNQRFYCTNCGQILYIERYTKKKKLFDFLKL